MREPRTRTKSQDVKPPSARRRPQDRQGPSAYLVGESQEYSLAELTRLFHLPSALLRSLAAAGFITPTSADKKTHYGFQDLLLLRLASALKAAKIPARRIIEAIERIRITLAPGSVLSTMALAASKRSGAGPE